MRAAIFTLLLTGVAATASAQTPAVARSDRGGDFGIGGEELLGGVTGLNFRYYVSNELGLQGTLRFGLGTLSVDTGGGDASVTQISLGVGLGLHYRIVAWSDGAISIATGLDVSTNSTSVEDVDQSTFTFGLGAGFQGEWFLDDAFSLHGQTGFRFAIGGGDTSSFDFSLGGDLFAGFGFTVWLS